METARRKSYVRVEMGRGVAGAKREEEDAGGAVG
jgi:hypothetical protein